MIIVRYFFWLLVYHLSMFLKMWPHQTIIGLVLWLYHFFRCMVFIYPQNRDMCIHEATATVIGVWTSRPDLAPPECIKQQFVAMHTATDSR